MNLLPIWMLFTIALACPLVLLGHPLIASAMFGFGLLAPIIATPIANYHNASAATPHNGPHDTTSQTDAPA